MNKYRTRIYDNYVSALAESSVPSSLADLENRGPTMRYVINTFFPKDKAATILDLGCGHGTLVHFAHEAGYLNTYGVDASAEQVDLSQKLGISKITQGNLIAALNALAPASLDAVIAFDVIEHFTKEELIDLVDAILLALKPSGYWIIHAPNAISPFVGAIRYGDFTHEQAFTPTSIKQLLISSGFRHFVFAECGPRVHGLKSLVRVLLWLIIRGILKFANSVETGSFESGYIWTRNFYTVAYK